MCKKINYQLFLVVIISLFSVTIRPQEYSSRFKQISKAEGLSQDEVFAIAQDSKGFLWFATQNGLNKYDGYSIKVFNHQPGNPQSISDYAVNDIFEDKDGFLWIATREGIDRFDPRRETYRHYYNKKDDLNTIPDNFCWQIIEDNKGRLFVGTKKGLCSYNPDKDNFIRHPVDDDLEGSSTGFINCLAADEKGNIWIGTNDGLYHFSNNTYKKFTHDLNDPTSLSDSRITSIHLDKNNNIWVGTFNGLNLLENFNNKRAAFKRYLNLSPPLKRFEVNIIRALTSDLEGNIWIGTMGKGLMKLDPEKNTITKLSGSHSSGEFFKVDEISSLFRDKTGLIWIGTYGYGVFKYNKAVERFGHFTYHGDVKNSLPNNTVRSIYLDNNDQVWLGTEGGGLSSSDLIDLLNGKENFTKVAGGSSEKSIYSIHNITDITGDKDGNIWYASFGGGVNKLNSKTNSLKNYKYSKDDPTSLGNDFIHAIHFDDKGILWIGTGAGGLNRLNPATGQIKKYLPNEKNKSSITSSEVSAIEITDNGIIWLGTTTKGIDRFNPKTETFKNYSHNVENSKSLSSNRILCIFEDSKQNIWIGTYGGGLNLYHKDSDTFTFFLKKHGLPGNSVFGITEDANHNLWITTDNGLARFDIENMEIHKYYQSDGLQGNLFSPNAIFRDKKSGYIFIGGTNGFNVFHPSKLQTNEQVPDIVITSFKIFNKEVTVGKYPESQDNKSPLQKNITFTENISLSYQENVFSFEFAALHYGNPDNNQYAYMMEGFDDNWIYSGNRRFVTYTNLDPGDYVFRVKGSNNEGIWNEEGTAINIIVDPPIWQTWWAYLVYAGIIVLAFFGFRRYELDRIKLKNELTRREFESKKMQEVDELKSKFFANISHEFRTPLTLILGITTKLADNKNPGSIDNDLIVLERNSRRLLKLINQLLELSKIQSGNVHLSIQQTKLITFTKTIAASFASQAENKNIKIKLDNADLDIKTEEDKIEVYIDREKMETVIFNLLSNGIKFSPPNSTLYININKDQAGVSLLVGNTGTGIQADDLKKIFDRFYQIRESGSENYEGTGIGLALVKELVELHKASIQVKSDGDNYVEFEIKMKAGKEHFEGTDIVETSDKPKLIKTAELTTKHYNNVVEPEDEILNQYQDDDTVILVVEDNEDLRNHIAETLSHSYKVVKAEDGKKGLDSAKEYIPDLIISDIMMPNMDGYELCKKLKGHQTTDHIPVILLTAKAETENKIEGLETGADDYLIKPFNKDELIVRVRNLINIRKKMREKFQSELTIKPAEVVVPSSQKVFIDRLTSVIEANIANEKFNVDELCNKIGMSRAQLHRKIKAITNQSTTEFIRNFRLQRAGELIKQDAGTMSEIAYMVGFNSQAYFNRSFQELFNCSPGEYKKKNTSSID